MTEAPFQRHFADRMSLQQVDRDIFTGWCHSGSPLRAYGGQIAAQSLMAAGQTVDGDERRVHSLHGYFLRPGQTKDSITYLVERPRDGRSFSTRIVRAVQHGETIFMMTASFAVTDDGPAHQFTKPDLPRPDMVADVPVPLPAYLEGVSTPRRARLPRLRHHRPADRRAEPADRPSRTVATSAWHGCGSRRTCPTTPSSSRAR